MKGEGDVVIRLRLFGFGNRPSRFRQQTVTLPQRATVGALLAWWRQQERGVPPDDLLIIINGQDARHLQGELTPLADNDEVTLMLPVAGGRYPFPYEGKGERWAVERDDCDPI